MPKYTMQVEYLLPVYRHVTVEAETLAEACAAAINSESEKEWQYDYDCSGPDYITGIVKGEHDDVYQPGGKAVRVPTSFRKAFRVKS